ncbi:MAG: aminomethyl-transferring glycine dehydrogenase subunit GcvPA [Eubacterium sp.]|jgi:glycine dehydrogenase subunit 1
MGNFVPGTASEQEEMLREAGYRSFDDMLSCIPDEVRFKGRLNLPEGKSEMEALRIMQDLSEQNVVYKHIFRGAGAYDHYIPAIVKSVTSKEEFVTSYTPYQAEISQGALQSIFEYQTMICELTGMDVANASHYDGSTAAAESLVMCRSRKRSHAYVAETVNPGTIEVMKTYCFGNGIELRIVPENGGKVDKEALADAMSDEEAACFFLQQPNYFGLIEDAAEIGDIVHEHGAEFVMGVDPISLGILKTPAECGADIVTGDGQPLGLPLSYGGPYLGFMAVRKKDMRRLPGRIVGETTDGNGNRAFVLTLQAREQHIRREKASSNICSNQALCALTSAVYLSALGADGLKQAATLCTSKAHYMADRLQSAGLSPVYDGEYFCEFVTETPVRSREITEALAAEGILGGLELSDNRILWCTTEKNTKHDIDEACDIVEDLIRSKGGRA